MGESNQKIKKFVEDINKLIEGYTKETVVIGEYEIELRALSAEDIKLLLERVKLASESEEGGDIVSSQEYLRWRVAYGIGKITNINTKEVLYEKTDEKGVEDLYYEWTSKLPFQLVLRISSVLDVIDEKIASVIQKSLSVKKGG